MKMNKTTIYTRLLYNYIYIEGYIYIQLCIYPRVYIHFLFEFPPNSSTNTNENDKVLKETKQIRAIINNQTRP